MKIFFNDKLSYTSNIISNLNFSGINLPVNKEHSRHLNSIELDTGYSTRLQFSFYSLPNLFLLNFYNKSFYIFIPSIKIINIFNSFTWLNFNRKFLKKTLLKNFLPLFLFPKLKKCRKKKILYGSGLYRRPYKNIKNYWKLLETSKLIKYNNIDYTSNYTIHPQFNKYRLLLLKFKYKLKTPQIRIKVRRFEQPTQNPFFKTRTFKKLFKTRKYLNKKKKFIIDVPFF